MTLSDKARKRLKFYLIKLPIIFAVFIGVMIMALKAVERYPDPLKAGFEQYLSNYTKSSATITTADKISFYPTIDIRLRDVSLHQPDNAAMINAAIKKFILVAPTSSLFLRQGTFRHVDIEGLRLSGGFALPYDLLMDQISIKSEEDGTYALHGSGRYAALPAILSIGLTKNNLNYKVAQNIPFDLMLGDYRVQGSVLQNFRTVDLQDVIFTKGDVASAPQTYRFFANSSYLTDNPVSCLVLHAGDGIKECDLYLTANTGNAQE